MRKNQWNASTVAWSRSPLLEHVQEIDIMKSRNLSAELPARNRAAPPASSLSEESLVADARAELSPRQMVDAKLASLLLNAALASNSVGKFDQSATGRFARRMPNAREGDC